MTVPKSREARAVAELQLMGEVNLTYAGPIVGAEDIVDGRAGFVV
jgi:hypothetical protein